MNANFKSSLTVLSMEYMESMAFLPEPNSVAFGFLVPVNNNNNIPNSYEMNSLGGCICCVCSKQMFYDGHSGHP